MARIVDLCDGAEFGDLLWLSAYAGDVSITTAQKATGTYSYKVSSEGWIEKMWTANTEMFFRAKLFGNWDNYYGTDWYLRSGSNNVFRFQMNSDLQKVVYFLADGTNIGTGVRPLPQATWNTFEIYYKMDGSAGSLVVKLNGLVDISYTGNTNRSGRTVVDNFYALTSRYNNWYWDDFAADNATWCGSGGYIYLPANGNGDVNQWLGNDADSTDNYQLVDEVPPDGDTTYVQDDTIGHQDLYHVTNYTVPTNYFIRGVFAECRGMDNGGGGAAMKLGVKPSGGSLSLSNSIALPGSYIYVKGNYLPTNPLDSQAWEEGDITDLQFGMEVA